MSVDLPAPLGPHTGGGGGRRGAGRGAAEQAQGREQARGARVGFASAGGPPRPRRPLVAAARHPAWRCCALPRPSPACDRRAATHRRQGGTWPPAAAPPPRAPRRHTQPRPRRRSRRPGRARRGSPDAAAGRPWLRLGREGVWDVRAAARGSERARRPVGGALALFRDPRQPGRSIIAAAISTHTSPPLVGSVVVGSTGRRVSRASAPASLARPPRGNPRARARVRPFFLPGHPRPP